jgi:ParB/RepB/Spo0J family partition protein
MEHIEITLALLHPSPTNPRKTFAADDMAEMIDSVKRHGILQPVLVRAWPNCYDAGEGQFPAYELVAGERRYRAAKGAGLESIPALVRDLSDHEVLEIQIIENLQRKGLHPLEEAESYELMIRDHGYTADQLAEKIGKSRAYIYGRTKLTALCTQARLAFRDGKLTASTALLIARIPGAQLQEKALDKITATWQGILSYRHAAEVVQGEFCFYLDQASFPQENALLVPQAGVCSICPRRSGTDPSLFPDIDRTDVCTDPDCYQAKVQAWLAYQKAQAKEAGKKVIDGDEAKKINIPYSHDKFVPLERRNYEIEGAPTYREMVEKIDVEIVMIEDRASGKLVEAVERKALAAALVAAGVKPERDYRHEERELERRTRAENEFRKRLFQAWHNEMRAQLDTEEQPDFEIDELRLVASTLWSNMYGENYEVVAGYWAAPSKEKEAWSRRHAMVREVADRISQMERRQLILFMLDCALSHNGRASQNSVDIPPAQLIEQARYCGIDPKQVRAEIEAEKAAKTGKKSPAKTTSTPSKAPLGEEPKQAIRPYELESGDRVQIKPDCDLINKGKFGYFRGYNPEGQAIVWLDGEPASYLCCSDELDTVPVTADAPPVSAPITDAGIKCQFAHPENPELLWRGKGKKPKWVENWLAIPGNTLDQLRIANQKDQSSAPIGANAKPCIAESAPRCQKTLELPLA